MAVLVDSSVWIAAAKSKSNECRILQGMIRDGAPICVTAPIRAEVCQGARTESEFARLWSAFAGFRDLVVLEEHWEQSAWNYYRCRKEGLSPATVDCLIATVASSYRAKIWTLDKIFPLLRPVIGFDLHS